MQTRFTLREGLFCYSRGLAGKWRGSYNEEKFLLKHPLWVYISSPTRYTIPYSPKISPIQ